MFTLERVMTAAGVEALTAERRALRIKRATAFARRHFGPRVAHLSDAELAHYVTRHFDGMAHGDLTAEQDQLSALAPAIYWGSTWWQDQMPTSILAQGGHWDAPLTSRAQLSRCLAALDVWRAAMLSDLADRNRVATILQDLYTAPRAVAARGRDPQVWCAEFAPQVWSLLDNNARYYHTVAGTEVASRYLPSFQDGIMFACIGLVLGVGFAENPLYPQFQRALAGHENRPADEIRIGLGTALVDYWKQIDGDLEQ